MSSSEASSSSEARTSAFKRRNSNCGQDPIAPDTNGKRPRSSETTTKSWHLRGTHSWHVSRSLAAALQGRNRGEEEEGNRCYETVRLCSDVFFLGPHLELNADCPPELRRIPFQVGGGADAKNILRKKFIVEVYGTVGEFVNCSRTNAVASISFEETALCDLQK